MAAKEQMIENPHKRIDGPNRRADVDRKSSAGAPVPERLAARFMEVFARIGRAQAETLEGVRTVKEQCVR